MGKSNRKKTGTTFLKRLRIGDYMRQLSIVVVGILITFQGSEWIGRASQRAEAREILSMIEDELRSNLDEIIKCKHALEYELDGMDFFTRYMYNIYEAPRDSVDLYLGVLGTWREFYYNSDALEVLKSSQSSVKVLDKGLQRGIFGCYQNTASHLKSANSYWEQKSEIIGEYYFVSDRKEIEVMHRHGDFYPFVSGYLKNVSTGNLILNTSGNIGDFPEMFEKLIETHRDVIGSMSRYKKKK